MRNSLKNELKENYTIVPNGLLSDNNLTDRARFLYCVLASKPDNWVFYNNALAKELKISVDTLRKYVAELIENGWITKQNQKINGQFVPNTYELKATNSSVSGKTRHGDLPTRENPDTYKEELPTRRTLNKEKETAKINYAEFVKMTKLEYSKLCEKHSKELTILCINKLNNYKGSTGKKYKSDYRAILSWVVDKIRESGVKSYNTNPLAGIG